MTIAFPQSLSGNNSIDPSVYCQIGDFKISGSMNISAMIPGPDQTDSWSMSGEIWPTLTVHNTDTLTAILNPISFNTTVNYSTLSNPAGEVSASGKVFDSGFGGTGFSGLVITHYPNGATNQNSYPSDVLQNNFLITAYRNNINDPSAATTLAYRAEGKVISNMTGTDITSNVCTYDGTSSRPLTWSPSTVGAPVSPPSSGALTITDGSTGSAIAAAINATDTSGMGDMTMTVLDNTVSTSDPYYQQTVSTSWDELFNGPVATGTPTTQ